MGNSRSSRNHRVVGGGGLPVKYIPSHDTMVTGYLQKRMAVYRKMVQAESKVGVVADGTHPNR